MPKRAKLALTDAEREMIGLSEHRAASTYGFNSGSTVKLADERTRCLLEEIEDDGGINQSTHAVVVALRTRLGGKRSWDVPVGRLPGGGKAFVRVNERGRDFGKRARPRSEHVESLIEAAVTLLAYALTQTGVFTSEEEVRKHPRARAAHLLRYAAGAANFAAMQRSLNEDGHPQEGFEEQEARATKALKDARALLRDPEYGANGGRPAKRPPESVIAKFKRTVAEELKKARPPKNWTTRERQEFALSLTARLVNVVGTQRAPSQAAVKAAIWRAGGGLRAQTAVAHQLLATWFRCDVRTARNWEKTTG